jgi:hypothetical protein
VSFAFEEPRKHAEKIKNNSFKIALVASDCLLLGKQCAQELTCALAGCADYVAAGGATTTDRPASAAHRQQQLVAVCRLACTSGSAETHHLVLCSAGLQPVLVHLSKNDKGKFSFNPLSVNLMTEVFKVVFALVVLLILVSITCGHSTDGSRSSSSDSQQATQRCAGDVSGGSSSCCNMCNSCVRYGGRMQSRWPAALPRILTRKRNIAHFGSRQPLGQQTQQQHSDSQREHPMHRGLAAAGSSQCAVACQP